jgi:uncharacterized protein (DUF433 family)
LSYGDATSASEEIHIPSEPLITQSEDVLWGTPVFAGTRVPVQTIFDYIKAGHTLEEFLDCFPSVSRDQTLAVLEWAKEAVLARATAMDNYSDGL